MNARNYLENSVREFNSSAVDCRIAVHVQLTIKTLDKKDVPLGHFFKIVLYNSDLLIMLNLFVHLSLHLDYLCLSVCLSLLIPNSLLFLAKFTIQIDLSMGVGRVG